MSVAIWGCRRLVWRSPPLGHELVVRDPEVSSDPEREAEWQAKSDERSWGCNNATSTHRKYTPSPSLAS